MSSRLTDAAYAVDEPGETWTGSYALPYSRRSPALARVLVGQALAGCPADAVETVQLLTSELVTNAIRHAESMVVLRISTGTAGWRVSVEDLSPDAPEQQTADGAVEQGRGLHLVEVLSARWGWERTPTGKTVWFEVDVATVPEAG